MKPSLKAAMRRLLIVAFCLVPVAAVASVTYSSSLKTNRMQLVADLISGKTVASSTGTATAGSLVIGTSSLSGATGVLATITLNAPCCTVSGSVMTISGTPLSATASATGTAAKAELRNNGGTAIVTGLTVGTTGTDIVLDNTSITSGQTVNITSGTITHSSLFERFPHVAANDNESVAIVRRRLAS